MASLLFGEVNYFTSRACSDDADDDSVTESSRVELRFKDATEERLKKCKLLIVSHGQLTNGFCELEFMDESSTELVGVQVLPNDGAKGETLAQVHWSAPGSAILTTSTKFQPAVANDAAQKIISQLSDDCVIIVVTSKHYSHLAGNYPVNGEDYVIHHLASPAFAESYTAAFTPLPQPALLESLPAAMMTRCVLRKRPCVIYAIYTECCSPWDIDLIRKPLQEAFHKEPFARLLPSLHGPSKVIGVSDLTTQNFFERYT